MADSGNDDGTLTPPEPKTSPPGRGRLRRWATGTAVAVLLLAIGGSGWWYFSRPEPKTIRFDGRGTAGPYSEQPYAEVLRAQVDDSGMVDYAALKANRGKLDEFAANLGKLDPKAYEAWPEAEKIAFWVNAYNTLTLELIVSHYPIRRSGQPEGLAFPANSIHQIPGKWDKVRFVVMGREMTLDQIEHETLRKQFNEPRIHVALVCAAMGCPPLRREPYKGDKLGDQLDDQARRFLSNPAMFRIDREKKTVHMSSIFNWFGGDFVKKHGTDKAFAGRSPAERAVLNFVSGYLGDADRQFLQANQFSIDYLGYDWSLNEQGGK